MSTSLTGRPHILQHTCTAFPASLSSAGPPIAHHLSRDGRSLVVARAAGDEVCLFDARHDLNQVLDFWEAFPGVVEREKEAASEGIQALRVRASDSQSGAGEVYLLAALGNRFVAWSASLISSTSTRRWRVHSTLNLQETIHSIDLHGRHLLLGVGNSVQVWTLEDGAHFWRRVWSKRAPNDVTHVEFNATGMSLAASSRGQSSIAVWHVAKPRTGQSSGAGPPFEAFKSGLLRHTSPVVSFQWRGLPESNSQADVLVSRSTDGAARIWAPVIDQPTKMRLSATVDQRSFGKSEGSHDSTSGKSQASPVLYLDAAALAAVLRSNIGLIERDLQLADVQADEKSSEAMQTERQVDEKRARLNRLQHFLEHTSDMFLCFLGDGSLVIRGLSNIDRRPPTLLQAFTLVKLHPSLDFPPSQLRQAQLVPMSVRLGQDCEAALGMLTLQNLSGATMSIELNPSLFFNGQSGGLVARDANMVATSSSRALSKLLTSPNVSSRLIALFGGNTSTSYTLQSHHGVHTRCSLRADEDESTHSFTPLAIGASIDLVWDHKKGQLAAKSRRGALSASLEGGPSTLDQLLAVAIDDTGVSVVTQDGEFIDWSIAAPTFESIVRHSQHLGSNGVSGSPLSAVFVSEAKGQKRSDRRLLVFNPHGRLDIWTTRSHNRLVNVRECKHTIDIGPGQIDLSRGSSSGMVVFVRTSQQRKSLEIWDAVASEFSSALQCSVDIATNAVTSIDWKTNAAGEDLLAVAQGRTVQVFARRRPLALEDADAAAPSWTVIAALDMSMLSTRSITDVKWLSTGSIAVALGHTLHVVGPEIAKVVDGPSTLVEAAYAEQGPLPPYHPNVLVQCLLWGKVEVAKRIFVDLWKSIQHMQPNEIMSLDSVPELRVEEILGEDLVTPVKSKGPPAGGAGMHASLFESVSADEAGSGSYNKELVDSLVSKLRNSSPLPGVTRQAMEHLIVVAHCLLEVTKQGSSLDDDGLRYLVALRAFLQRQGKKRKQDETDSEDGAPTTSVVLPFEQPRLRHRDFVWALHSNCQETLLAAIKDAYQDKLTWQTVRATGIFLWLKSPVVIAELAEQVARDQFMSTEDRDPVSCSLFYYALGKRKLVLNLWRQAAWHPEQRKMLAFLANDFESDRWKSAALKNAFALLSQRRFEFAACFFLLGDSLQDAVNVCVRNLQDVHLAIALCRIKEGRDDGPVFTALLQSRVLPMVFEHGYRWLGHWAFWMLKMRDCATKILVSPLADLRTDPRVLGLLPAASSGITTNVIPAPRYEDVALAIFFLELKRKTLLTLKGSREVSPRQEWGFVLHMNRTLRRMGCHIIGLALLAGWEFTPPPKPRSVLVPAPPSSGTLNRSTPSADESRKTEQTSSAGKFNASSESDRAQDLFAALNERAPSPPVSPILQQRRTSASRTPLRTAAHGVGGPRSPPNIAQTSSHQRRRSSLLRRRSSVIDDLNLDPNDVNGHGGESATTNTGEGGKGAVWPLPPTTASPTSDDSRRLETEQSRPNGQNLQSQREGNAELSAPAGKEAADQHKEGDPATESPADEEPKRGKGSLFRPAATAAQQGAQEFNFDNFGF
ncbi:unnamed protein product [Parajaminaea phylloscopi]